MSITQTALTSGADGTNAYSIDTASVSPSANKLVLLAIEVDFMSAQSSAPAATITGNGLTWVLIATRLHWADSSNWWNCLYLYRTMGASPSTGAVTLDFGATQYDSIAWAMSEFTGMDTSGTNGSGAIVQSASNYGAATDTVTVTLASFGSANNATYGCFGVGDTGGTSRSFTPGTGFSEIHDTGFGYASLGTQWRNDNDTSVDSTASASSSGMAGIAVEIKQASAYAPLPIKVWSMLNG